MRVAADIGKVLFATVPAVILGGTILAFAVGTESPAWSGKREIHALDDARQWLNSKPLTAEELKGKVVLVSFWTYSCVNWIRTQPYLRAWAEKYKDKGLVIVGVHSPEFGFEKNLDNVRWAVDALDVGYPVVIDNDFAIWNAFSNQYWPAFYFIDGEGRIRHEKFGEGEYEQSERVLMQLLAENGATIGNEYVSLDPQGLEAAADWSTLATLETYVGSSRATNFASPVELFGLGSGPQTYTIPETLRLNQWALAGNWTMGSEASVLNAPGGRISFKFRARDANLVMGPAGRGSPVRFRLLIDGQPPGAAHGADIDEAGYGTIVEQRLYQLIRQPAPIVDRTLEIEFLDAGAELFSFTFG
jgi:thiol-disulfide isomerase/thioredoxin